LSLRWVCRISLPLIVLLVIGAPLVAQDEKQQLDDLAAELAGAIVKSSKGAPSRRVSTSLRQVLTEFSEFFMSVESAC